MEFSKKIQNLNTLFILSVSLENIFKKEPHLLTSKQTLKSPYLNIEDLPDHIKNSLRINLDFNDTYRFFQ